ncbi:MAG: cytochrome P450, partial [Micrococcales bacterium]
GPRLCIGRDMARVESVAALAVLLARFDILPVGRAPRPEALVTLRPHGGLRLRMGPVHCSTSTG